jgi:hypothetical protein
MSPICVLGFLSGIGFSRLIWHRPLIYGTGYGYRAAAFALGITELTA